MDKNGIYKGALIAIISSLLTIFVQHYFSESEKKTQLYLNEKQNFVEACNDYLKQYREWHELMNYFVYKDSNATAGLSKLDTIKLNNYINWRQNIDYSYGKLFLLSDNDFGFVTLKVSTILHFAIREMITSSEATSGKEKKLNKLDQYFFEKWLTRAQEEIFRYNTGERLQISLKDFKKEQEKNNQFLLQSDSIDTKLYQDLEKIYDK